MNTKKIIPIIFSIILIIFSLILPSHSSKNLMIYYQIENNYYSNNIKESSIIDYYLTKDAARFNTKSNNKDSTNYSIEILIKKGDKGDKSIYYYIIDDKNKYYMEISEEFFKNIYSNKVKYNEDIDANKLEIKKTENNKIIDKYKCEKYDFIYEGKKITELYLTKYKNLVKPEYTNLYKDIKNSSIYTKALEMSHDMSYNFYKSKFGNLIEENIVIKSNFYKDDKLVSESNLKDFKIVNRDPKLFEIPKNYMKIDYKDLYKK
jgi:hypothetical protein